ncbi:MAG: outer membrane lipoprotein carrier protein [Halieaceae bacterium]|jgi:outer membrane lipoprotein carrier protein
MRRLTLIVLFALGSGAASAQLPATELSALLGTTQSMQGKFTQQTVDATGATVETSVGLFRLLQPDYFYWEITSPDHQIFVSDGSKLTHYDVDLEQAVVQAASASGALNPARILSGGGRALEARFVIEQLGNGAKNEFRLTPREDIASFTHFTLFFDADKLIAFEIADGFEQTTRIVLSDQTSNDSIGPESFLLNLPPDVDLIRND